MDIRAILDLIVTADAFATRGDNRPSPLPTTARAASARAREVLLRRLDGAFLSGAQVTLDTKSIAQMIRQLDFLLLRGDGRPAPMVGEDKEALALLRDELAARILSDHPGGDTITDLLGPTPRPADLRPAPPPPAPPPAPAPPEAPESSAPLMETFIFGQPGNQPLPPASVPPPGEAPPDPPQPASASPALTGTTQAPTPDPASAAAPAATE